MPAQRTGRVGAYQNSSLARALEYIEKVDPPKGILPPRQVLSPISSRLNIGAAGPTQWPADNYDTVKQKRESIATAIDNMLSRQQVPRAVASTPLEAALATTLQSRERIATALSNPDFPESLGIEVAGKGAGLRDFGRALADAWAGEERPNMADGDPLFGNLGQVEAARVGGLLKHLEWAVDADPQVRAETLLEQPWPSMSLVGPKPRQTPAPCMLQYASLPTPPPLTMPRWREDYMNIETFPDAPAREKFDPERILAFRRRMEAVHGSMAAGFKAMDISQRGLVSFGDFHAHLVRLHLCKVDAASSRQALELFKQLDVDLDDFICPQDVAWALALASKAQADDKVAEQWEASLRFPTRPEVTAEEALSFVTFRRYLEVRFGSFLAGLHAMDMDGTGQLSKAAFTRQLLQAGYCTSVDEALSLFRALDIHAQNIISIKEVAALESSGDLWLDLPIAPVLKPFDGGPPYRGSYFSQPARLNDPYAPPLRRRQRSRRRAGAASRSPDEVSRRLATTTTGHFRAERSHAGGSSPVKVMHPRAASAFVDAERHRLTGRSKSREARKDLFGRLDLNQDGKLSREEVRGFAVLHEKFETLDRDGDGFISRFEFATGYGGIVAPARATPPATSAQPAATPLHLPSAPPPATSPPRPQSQPCEPQQRPSPPSVAQMPLSQTQTSEGTELPRPTRLPLPDTMPQEVHNIEAVTEGAQAMTSSSHEALRDRVRQRQERKQQAQMRKEAKEAQEKHEEEEEQTMWSWMFGGQAQPEDSEKKNEVAAAPENNAEQPAEPKPKESAGEPQRAVSASTDQQLAAQVAEATAASPPPTRRPRRTAAFTDAADSARPRVAFQPPERHGSQPESF